MDSEFQEVLEAAIVEVIEKATAPATGSFPLPNIPGYASASEVGVQMPGPMPTHVGEAETYQESAGSSRGIVGAVSFEPTGADMRDEHPLRTAAQITGVQLPGATGLEPGWAFGEDTRDYAPRQAAPQGMNFGFPSGNGGGEPDADDTPTLQVIGRMPPNQFDIVREADMMPAFERLRDKAGLSVGIEGSVTSAVPGQSMAGLPLAPGSGVLGGTGDTEGAMLGEGQEDDMDEDDSNNYPAGPVLHPGQGVPRFGAGRRPAPHLQDMD